MPWWNGSEIMLPNKEKITVFTLKEALEKNGSNSRKIFKFSNENSNFRNL
jgi:hypothetical protein